MNCWCLVRLLFCNDGEWWWQRGYDFVIFIVSRVFFAMKTFDIQYEELLFCWL